jgi:hypothetical protein
MGMRNAVRAVCLVTGLMRLPGAEALEKRPSGQTGMRPGEAATFKFSVGPVESGRARMVVSKPLKQDGRTVVTVHGQAETAPWLQLIVRLNDDYQLVLDAGSLLPLSVLSVEHGIRERTIDAHLNGRRADLSVTGGNEAGHRVRVLPKVSRDPLAQLFALRAAPLVDGERLVEDVLDGTALWRVEMTVHRGERIRLDIDGDGSSARPAIRVDGVLTKIDDAGRPVGQPQRHVSAWLSDDEARVLLRLDADTDLGRCSLELTQYLPPRR